MKKIFIMNIGTELGGIEKSLIEFLKFLIKENCQIDLALWKKRGPLFGEIPKGVNIIENIGPGSFSSAQKNGINGLWYYFKFKLFKLFNRAWKSVPKIKGHYDIAISYCHNGYSPYYVIDKVDADKKFIWFHHGSYDGGRNKKKLDNKYYQKYDKVVTVSESNRKMLKSLFVNVEIEVIPNIIDEEKIRQMADEEIDAFNGFRGLKITTVGRISKEKGQDFSLEIAKELKERGIAFKWVFVGDGEELERCIKKTKEYNIEGSCVFIGAKVNPYPYIKQADLYVQTSFVEAQPTTIREALVLNIPIIASNIEPILEVLDDKESCITCELSKELFAEEIKAFSITTTSEQIKEDSDQEKIKNKIMDFLELGSAWKS